MTDSTLLEYRNVQNDLVGLLTPEQAALFPDLLELVEIAEEEVEPTDVAKTFAPSAPSTFITPAPTTGKGGK